MSFRLNWTFSQFADFEYAAHRAVMKSPWKFYLALFAKLVPGLYESPVTFELLDGKVIGIVDFMSIYIYKEIFVDGCYDGIDIGTERPRVIEVGANTGLFALRIKSTYPDAEIISFEPFPPNYARLLETLDRNGIEGVKPVRMAVSDRSGRASLFIHPGNIGGHSMYRENAGEDCVEVETTTIARILDEYGISACDLLKLDCEGAEYPILKSFTSQIAGKIRNIIYEPTPGQYSVEELNHFLNGLGYRTRTRGGLVLASMDGHIFQQAQKQT